MQAKMNISPPQKCNISSCFLINISVTTKSSIIITHLIDGWGRIDLSQLNRCDVGDRPNLKISKVVTCLPIGSCKKEQLPRETLLPKSSESIL